MGRDHAEARAGRSVTCGEVAVGLAIILFGVTVLMCLGGHVIAALVTGAFMSGCLALAGEWD